MFVDDLRQVKVGDARSTRRIVRVANALAARPGESFPRVFANASQLEAAYRCMSRPATDLESILEAHASETFRRARAHRRVLVVHDTTEFVFDDLGVEREHLSQLTTHRHGFYLHASIAVAQGLSRLPLGVTSAIPYVHRSQVEASSQAFWAKRGGLYENESERWLDGVRKSHAVMGSCRDGSVVHVCDREGDAWPLLHGMQSLGASYVVRCAQPHRRLADRSGGVDSVEAALHRSAAGTERRIIEVPDEPAGRSERARRDKARGRSTTLPRRTAVVQVRWVDVELPGRVTSDDGSPEQAVVYACAVQVCEVNPPEGRRPADWILYHNEHVPDETAAWTVVDMYRQRWLIEEYFKVIKTGLAYESRQLTTAHALLNALAITLVVAGDILSLRAHERDNPNALATSLFDADFVAFTRKLYPKLVPTKHVTLAQILAVIAQEGGHLRQNGPPGWLVLYRGYVSLRDGWRMQSMIDANRRSKSPTSQRIRKM